MQIPGRVFNIARVAYTGAGRPAIQGLHIERGRVEATNGKILIRNEFAAEGEINATIYRGAALQASKLEMVNVEKTEGVDDLLLSTKDQSFVAPAVAGEWPTTDRVFQTKESIGEAMNLDVRLLRDLCDTLLKIHPQKLLTASFQFFRTPVQNSPVVHITASDEEIQTKALLMGVQK